MKNSVVTCFVVILSISVFNSCSSQTEEITKAEQEVKEANRNLELANKEYLEDIEDYKRETEMKINSNKASIAKLRSEKKEANKELNQEKNEKIGELEERNNKMEQKMKAYQANSNDNWEDFKSEFAREMDELGTSLNNLFTKNSKR